MRTLLTTDKVDRSVFPPKVILSDHERGSRLGYFVAVVKLKNDSMRRPPKPVTLHCPRFHTRPTRHDAHFQRELTHNCG